MSIEFFCRACREKLRTSDEAAGRSIACPACGAGVTIPTPEVPLDVVPLPVGENPFATPPARPPAPIVRDGPPWERDAMRFRSYFATLTQGYTAAGKLFAQMRRSGGYGPPLAFATIGTMSGFFCVGGTFLAPFDLAVIAEVVSGNSPSLDPTVMKYLGYVHAGLVVGVLVILPATMPLQLFLNAGIRHLMLRLVGEARGGFEVTFRAEAYAMGLAMPLMWVPICGMYVEGVAQLVFVVWALASLHEITVGTVVLSLLAFVAVVFLIYLGLFLTVFIGLSLFA